MSLAIETDSVTHVLLSDGWHEVFDNSFDVDSFEFLHGDQLIHGGGASGICPAGFSFTGDDGRQVFGPLTSILAVSIAPKQKASASPDERARVLLKWCRDKKISLVDSRTLVRNGPSVLRDAESVHETMKALVEQGLASVEPAPKGNPGRPKHVWRIVVRGVPF